VAFSAGRGVERKLTDMGLPIGSEFTIVARQPGGPVVIAREGMRLALGSGIGHRIMVSRAHGP
jgi:ferrous iron transport protein A